jgi:hypothetical protein
MLSRLDPYGEVTYTPSQMADLRDEVGTLLGRVDDARERRGLLRLRALADHGSQIPGSVLRAVGD